MLSHIQSLPESRDLGDVCSPNMSFDGARRRSCEAGSIATIVRLSPH